MTDAERMRRHRERVRAKAENEVVSLRLDRDVLAKLREAGPEWRTRTNALLRQALHLEA